MYLCTLRGFYGSLHRLFQTFHLSNYYTQSKHQVDAHHVEQLASDYNIKLVIPKEAIYPHPATSNLQVWNHSRVFNVYPLGRPPVGQQILFHCNPPYQTCNHARRDLLYSQFPKGEEVVGVTYNNSISR